MVADLFQAQTLKKFASYISRIATPLTLAVDATLRTGKVRSVSQADGNWHRESYRQIGGFGVGALFGGVAGAVTYKIGAAASVAKLGIVLGTGPIGWVLLGCVVIASAGVALVVANQGGNIGERLGDIIYNIFQ